MPEKCIQTEIAYLIGSVYLWGSPSSILHVVFFHLGTHFWTGSNVACRLDNKGEATKNKGKSCHVKVDWKSHKWCNCEMKHHTWIDLFWFSAMKGTYGFKKTGKKREEQCVKQGYCLPWQHTFQPQILCFSHVPAIISTQKTPERLLWQHFKGFPTSLLKTDDWVTNWHGYVFWHQLFGFWIFNVMHTEV